LLRQSPPTFTGSPQAYSLFFGDATLLGPVSKGLHVSQFFSLVPARLRRRVANAGYALFQCTPHFKLAFLSYPCCFPFV